MAAVSSSSHNPGKEWAYMLAGHARVTAIDADGRNFIDDLGPGDLWNFQAGLPHSIQALADGCEFLLVFDDGMFSENETFLLTDWFDHTPLAVLAKNLGVSPDALARIPRDPNHERYIFSGEVPPPRAQDVVRSPAGEVPVRRHLTQPMAVTDPAAAGPGPPGPVNDVRDHLEQDQADHHPVAASGRGGTAAGSGRRRTARPRIQQESSRDLGGIMRVLIVEDDVKLAGLIQRAR